MRRRLHVFVYWAGIIACLPLSAFAQTRPAVPAVTDAAAGRRIFDAQCAWCHGNEGDGGAGPNLHGKLLHATNASLDRRHHQQGHSGHGHAVLPSSHRTRDTRQTATYAMSLSRTAARPGPGNAERGAAVFQSTGCGSCHAVEGRGGILGPELTTIGGRRGAVYLREALVKPAASHPPGYLVVRAVPNTGAAIRGIRVNEDVFSILIRDASGAVHSLQKSDLARLDREPEATLMPSYESRLSPPQLDDIVSYLASLRGAK